MIVLAALLRTTGSTASGISVGEVDKRLAGAMNVHIVARHRDAGIVQQFWIAGRSNVMVEWTTKECVLYDLAHDRLRTRASQTGPAVSGKLRKPERDRARRYMASCLRNLVTGVSPDARLRRARGEIDSGVPEGRDVYDLPSPSQAEDSPLRDSRLVYIDRATGLPQRMELYRQARGQDRGDPMTTTIFTYPTDQEMDLALAALFPAP